MAIAGKKSLSARLIASVSLFLLVIMAASLFYQPVGVSAQQSPEQELADKYSPILMLKQQSGNCDYKGEGYFPTTVDWLWDNPDISLRVAGDGDNSQDAVLKTAPSVQDLVTAGPDTYLDFPGDPRNPGCAFEQYFKQKAIELGLEPTIYAKYVYSPTEHRLYLQYWYYFFFNDWNDTHESDWEMLALGFNAETAEEALTMEPSWVGYAQHGGGETANWNDASKLGRDGDHPIAYLSAGSHATYYNANTMIGWGENGSAFGCDVTTAPSTEVRPQVVVIPDKVDANGPFAWTLFQGRWGQREVAMYSGPVGPNMGKKWNDPVTAFGDWRTSILVVPSNTKAIGVNATSLFCSLSEKGSRAVVYFGSHPWLVGLLVLGILLLVGFSIWKVWVFFVESLDIYGNELRTFLGIGAFAIPLGLLFNGFRVWASDVPPLEWVQDYFNDSNAGKLTATLIVAVFQQLAILLLITPAIVYAMKDIRAGIKPGVWSSYKGSLRLFPPMVLSLIIVSAIIVALSWTIFLVPVAIYVVVRLQFFIQAIVLDGRRGWKAPIQQSWQISRGRWLHTFMLTLAFQLLAVVPGPLIGVVMMIIGGTNVRFANGISSLLYALMVPLSFIGITLVYRRLKHETIIEPFMLTRERDAKKAAESEALRDEAAQQIAKA